MMNMKIAFSFICFLYGFTAMLITGLVGILGETAPQMVTASGVIFITSAVIVVITWVINLK